MDSKQFDELVSRLASGQSRRDALKGIAGGALASVAGIASVASSEGKGKKGRKASAQNKGKGKAKASGRNGRNKVSSEIKGKGGKCRRDGQCVSGKCNFKKGDNHPGR